MEKHQTEFKEAIENTPIIPAIKDAESLEQCLKSDACVIFILFGDICNIAEIVERIKAEGKLAMVHMDLIAGLGSKEVSVDYIKERTKADGIITTKPMLAKHARELGLATVLRFFIIDSMAVDNTRKMLESFRPDMIEIMPGVMPKIIKSLRGSTSIPLIAGGLISEKKEVMELFEAGADAISTTRQELWYI